MKDIDSLKLVAPLNIEVVFLDSITRQWAVEFCERTQSCCGEENVQVRYWKLDALMDSETREQASAWASLANILVVAAYERADLGRHFKTWMEDCLRKNQGTSLVLVALFGKNSSGSLTPSPALDYLAALAELSSIDYYLREFTLEAPLHHLSFDEIAARATTTAGLLNEILEDFHLHSRRGGADLTTLGTTGFDEPHVVDRIIATTDEEDEEDPFFLD